MTNPGNELRDIHSREVPSILHPDQFEGIGATPIGARSLNRTGGLGGTSMSEDAGHVANSSRSASEAVASGEV